jgi:hypothetical protein
VARWSGFARVAGLAAMLASGCVRPIDGSPDASSTGSADGSSGAAADVATNDAIVSPADAGTPDDGGTDATVAPRLASTVVARNAGTVDALIADGATLYWVTGDNALWVLDAGSATPRRLAQDAGKSTACISVNRLAANATDLFWLAQSTNAKLSLDTALHRTAKSGASDVVIASGLLYADAPLVAADQQRVYWVEGEGSPDGINPASFIRALPADASPGTTPATLVETAASNAITSMTLAGPMLYWASVYLYSTISWPGLYGETITDLLAPHPPPPTPIAGSRFAQPHDGDLYVEIVLDLWDQDLGRITPGSSTPIDLAPIDGEDNIVFVDDWALVSVPTNSCVDHRHSLVAVRTSGPRGVVVPLADDLGSPAVLGTNLVFVDLMGQVHTSTLDQVRAALAPTGAVP